MSRVILCLLLAAAFFSPRLVLGEDDGPPISITSPDSGSTYPMGSIKNHSLYWSKSKKMLIAKVTFIDVDSSLPEDSHEFRLPGVTFDEAKGIFSATTAKGEVIPVAQVKKDLFIKNIRVMPNANIRVVHQNGEVTVILEAISPNDPAMRQATSDHNGTQQLDIGQILN